MRPWLQTGVIMAGVGVLLVYPGAPVRASVSSAAEPVRASAEAFLTMARRAYDDGLYDVAEQHARAVLAAPPDEASRASAIPILLESLAGLSRTNALAEALLTGLVPRGEDALLYWQGRLAWIKGDGKGALALLKGFETRYPESAWLADALNLRVLAAIAGGDMGMAVSDMAAFDAVCGDANRRLRNHLDWGRARLVAGDPAGAMELLTPLTTDEGRLGLSARYWRARAGLQVPGERAAALKELAALAAMEELPVELRAGAALALAEVAVADGNVAGAVATLRGALGWFQANSTVLRLEVTRALASSLLQLDQVGEAAERVREVLAADSESVVSGQLLLELAARQLAQGDAESAHASYQRYLETFPFPEGEAVATAGRAAALMQLGKFAHAAADFERAAALFKEEERQQTALLQAGEALVANDQSGLAAAHFTRIVTQWPDSPHVPRALFLLGVGCAARGEHEQADGFFQRVVEQYPKATEAEASLLHVALIHEGMRDWIGAEAGFTAMLERYPDGRFVARGLYGRGRARYEAGLDGALEDLERVDSLGGPTEVLEKAVFLRAQCLYRLGRDAEALALCTDYPNRFPGSTWVPRVHFWVGSFLFNEARYEEAEQQFIQFVELFHEDALADDALLRAGMSAARGHAFVRANDLFGKLAKQYPQSDRLGEARFSQGEALLELGEFGAAILAFDEVINKFVDSRLVGMAWARKGDCQFMLGATEPERYEESLTSYRVVAQIAGMDLDKVLEAEYKVGRSLQKQGHDAAALNQYYSRVMVSFLDAQAAGTVMTESAKLWFTRAADKAVEYLQAQGQWRQMGRVLEHVASAGVSTSDEAARRARRLRQDHWWDFL